MGQIAAEAADAVVLTDDNPRSEDGARILDEIAAGIGDRKREVPLKELAQGAFAKERARRMAIRGAIAAAGPDDVVLIAGKGHENTQTIGARVLPFDDVTEARRVLNNESAPAFIDAQLVAKRGQLNGTLPAMFFGVTTDSRRVEKGALYVALRGERFDGHDFIPDALAKGAAAALVHEKTDATPTIKVEDTLTALQEIAHEYVMTLPAFRVGLTGSNGKTTTKELIAACLRAALGAPYVLATEGNLNNHIGVPLTLLRAEPEHKALVIEMGMNHLGEIARLSEIARPHVGLITNIGTAHAGNVGGVEGVAKAKAELFEALPADGVAVVNADDPRCVREAQAKAKCKQVSFGRAPWADVKIVAVRDRESGGQEIELVHGGKTVETSIPLDGRHNAQNAAGAVAVGVALGLPFEVCALGLANVHGAHGRLERVVLKGGVWLLDDTYNANPDSMEAALTTLAELAGERRRVVVLGEMRELGTYAEQAHRHVGAAAAQNNAALLFACGDLGKLYGEGAMQEGLAADRFIWTQDNQQLAQKVIEAVTDGDVVLVKGSRGARMEVVVDALRRHRT
jgi:UDP-N-acetylmuramoyl-tripeptide--D-alanyl-D-alanine ligase